MKRLLVTGRSGFVGRTLTKMLGGEASLGGWTLAAAPENWDLLDPGATEAVVGAAPVDAVLHLAAQSWVPDSLRDPEATLNVNIIGTLHLLQALVRTGFGGRIVYVGSADVYGWSPEGELPITEECLPAPRNPYAVSKLAAEALCRQWGITENMDVVLARPFNHIGPGQSDRFVISNFARQVAEIKLGRREPVVLTGDIDVTRDFTDVRDVVAAYFALLSTGVRGEVYNVCSGQSRSIRSVLETLARIAGVAVTTRRDEARLRPSEQRDVRGDPTKIRRATAWRASIPIEESLASMLTYWESAAAA